jgi:RNA polymerase sigma-70 factor, ECF subfamily
MTGLKSEEQQAFEQQALVHTHALYRLGMHLTGNADDAGDLVQETYLKAFRYWGKYDGRTYVRAWLFRILKNTFIDLYRRESRGHPGVRVFESLIPTSAQESASYAHNGSEQVFDRLFDDVVADAVSDLPEDFRTVVILHDIEGLSYAEVASFSGCPLGTVRSRLHRGRKLLHVKLYMYARKRGHFGSMRNAEQVLQPAMEM